MGRTSTRAIEVVGELLCDFVIAGKQGAPDATFVAARGGGSAGNFAANAASHGCPTQMSCYVGSDKLAELCWEELRSLGVHEGSVSASPAPTKRIFQYLYKDEDLIGSIQHKFSLTCPVCGTKTETGTAAPDAKLFTSALTQSRAKAVYVDGLSRARAAFLHELTISRPEVLTVLDVGHVAPLRYLPSSLILSTMVDVGVLYLSRRVYNSVLRRNHINEDYFLSMPRGTRSNVVIVSDGSSGFAMHVFYRGAHAAYFSYPAPRQDIVDDAGAGDCLLGSFTAHYVNKFMRSARSKMEAIKIATSCADIALRSVSKKLLKVGARGHLSKSRHVDQWTGLEGQTIQQLQAVLAVGNECPLCAQSRRTKSQTKALPNGNSASRFRSNVVSLLSRIDLGAFDSETGRIAARLLSNERAVQVVGTGGSFPAAKFVADVFAQHDAAISEAVLPGEYIRRNRVLDTLIAISYSGRTQDIGKAIDHAIRKRVKKIILITGRPQSSLQQKLRPGEDLHLSFETEKDREKGFVSVRATVLPCALFALASSSHDQYRALLLKVQREMWGGPNSFSSSVRAWLFSDSGIDGPLIIDVYGSGLTSASMVDLESKFTEGGLGFVRIHESKDFSHGRFISVMHRDLQNSVSKSKGIVFQLGERTRYEQALLRNLRRYQNILEISSAENGVLGALEILIKAQVLVSLCADAVGLDISRPRFIAPGGLRLYKWKAAI